MKDLMSGFRFVMMALAIAAVVQELRKPKSERRWRGHVNVAVPYDFTMPTKERLEEAYWNPKSDNIITDRVLGVGWAVNAHALLRKLGWNPPAKAE